MKLAEEGLKKVHEVIMGPLPSPSVRYEEPKVRFGSNFCHEKAKYLPKTDFEGDQKTKSCVNTADTLQSTIWTENYYFHDGVFATHNARTKDFWT